MESISPSFKSDGHVTLSGTLIIMTSAEALECLLLLNMEPWDYHVNEPKLASQRWTEVPEQTACQLPDMWGMPSKTTQPPLTATLWVSLGKTNCPAEPRLPTHRIIHCCLRLLGLGWFVTQWRLTDTIPSETMQTILIYTCICTEMYTNGLPLKIC